MKSKAIGILKNVFETIGGVALFAAGLIFVLIGDVKISLSSYWMILMIVLSAGGGLAFIVASYKKDKPISFYVIRCIGILLSVGFVVALFIFFDKFSQINKYSQYCKLAFALSLSFSLLGILCQVANVILNVVKGIEE